MRRLLLLTSVFACALTLTTASLSAKPRSNGQIVFAAAGGVTFADVTGGRELRIDPPDYVLDVTMSPDGARLAYQTLTRHGVDLYAADRSGRNRWTLATGALDIEKPAWSPDGTQVVYGADDEVWIARVKGHSYQRLSDIGGSFAWSPDGRTLAYGGGDGLMLVDSKTHAQHALVPIGDTYDTAWTPDGRNIVYRASRQRVYVVNVPGPTQRPRLVVGKAQSFELSPDGRTVAYVDHGRLFAVPLAGGQPRLIAPDFFEYAWSPDSTRIAFSHRDRSRGNVGSIIITSRRGGAPHRLLTNIGPDGARWPSWSPDSRQIAYERTEAGFSLGRGYVVDADGTHDRQLLPDDPEARPEAATISWLTQPIALPAPTPEATLVPAQQARASSIVAGLAVDGNRALTISGGCCSGLVAIWKATVWSPNSSAVDMDVPCSEELTSFAIAGDQVGYTCAYGGLDPPEVDVYRTPLRPAPAPPTLTISGGTTSVAGAGQLLVATVDHQLLRLDSDSPPVPIRTYPSFPVALAVDQSRVLVEPDAGSLEVVATDGTAIAGFPAAHGGGAVLRGDRVYTVQDGRLTVRDLSGSVEGTRDLVAGAQLEDASGDLVLYTAASRLHLLRLTDGKDDALRLPGQFLRAWARFSADGGILYAYNAFAPQGYWTGYVPASSVNALLG
jgi:Tol biopolymer transport system component